MPLVVVGHRTGAAFLHRQAGLRTIQSLNLALFVDTEHQGVFRGIQVEADYIAQLLDKTPIPAQLERFHPMGLQAVRLPDALRCHFGDPELRGQSSGTPMRSGRGLFVQGGVDDPFHQFRRDRRFTSRTGLVVESRHALGSKSRSPQDDGFTVDV